MPADYFKPMMVDRYLHKLVNAFELTEDVEEYARDPHVLKEQYVKPNLQMAHLDFQLNDQQSDAIVCMLKLHIEVLYGEFV